MHEKKGKWRFGNEPHFFIPTKGEEGAAQFVFFFLFFLFCVKVGGVGVTEIDLTLACSTPLSISSFPLFTYCQKKGRKNKTYAQKGLEEREKSNFEHPRFFFCSKLRRGGWKNTS